MDLFTAQQSILVKKIGKLVVNESPSDDAHTAKNNKVNKALED